MYTKVPSSSRCCFCTPPKYGLLVWAYLKLIFNVVAIGCSLTWFSVVGTFFKFRFTVYDIYALILSTSVLILFTSDILFNVVLIIGIHKKHSTLPRLFYRYGIVHTVLLVALGLIMIAFLLSSTSGLRRDELGNILVTFTTICCLLIVFHLYLLPLVRNEVSKLKPNDQIQFVINNADNEGIMQHNIPAYRYK